MHGEPIATFGGDMDDLLQQRYGRRLALKTLVVGSGATAATIAATAGTAQAATTYAPGEPTFDAIIPDGTDEITLATGFTHDIVISWGDPITTSAPAFDVENQTRAAQEVQCGFNHSHTEFRPLPNWNSTSSTNGLLFINHEYTDPTMMFENYTSTPTQVDVEMASLGATIVEVNRSSTGVVTYNPASPYNRRITAFTPMQITGPIAGDPRIQTTSDPTGTSVLGMLGNNGGGTTPWGTILTAEHNTDRHWNSSIVVRADWAGPPNYTFPVTSYPYTDTVPVVLGDLKSPFDRFDFPLYSPPRTWMGRHARFDAGTIDGAKESLKFGYIVEIDPYDPQSIPKKRTALARGGYSSASGALAPSGRYVTYCGPGFVFKFITEGSFDPSDRVANMDLLDSGTLYVARLNANGTGAWLPLEYGTGPLISPKFDGQADVLMRPNHAGSALGGTWLARPDDIAVNPVTKKVYAVMNGETRGWDTVNPVIDPVDFPEGGSISLDLAYAFGKTFGHVIEITETDAAQDALTFTWEIFLLCGEPNGRRAVNAPSRPTVLNPTTPGTATWWAGYDETKVSPIARVSDVTFTSDGMMYLSTDGMAGNLHTGYQPDVDFQPRNDSVYAMPTEGAERGHGKALLCGVAGGATNGPTFTPDDRTLFLAITHPGVHIAAWGPESPDAPEFAFRWSSTRPFASPGSTWNTTPAIQGKTPGVPRSATLAVRRSNFSGFTFGTVDTPTIPQMPSTAVVAATATGIALAGIVHLRNRTSPDSVDLSRRD
jgi:uncharacterized protein